MRVWIDLANSPHPPLFAPVARRLEEAGAEILVTARDHAQTVELGTSIWPDLKVVGHESPKGRAAKAAGLARRVGKLRSWARDRKPDAALSHNSYAQIAAARAAGIRVVTGMDFEHQPANHVAFRLAHRILLPAAYPEEAARRQGARPSKVVRYEGLKESLYLGDFTPDPGVLKDVGLDPDPAAGPLVVLRAPPSRALYHHFDNPLFTEVLNVLGSQRVRCVVLARHPEQREELSEHGPANCVVPAKAVDARSLMYAADLVIGAGGTMSREAALMGVPAMSVFAGTQPAVDRELERKGRLTRLVDAGQVSSVQPRRDPPAGLDEIGAAGEPILRRFVDCTLSVAGQV